MKSGEVNLKKVYEVENRITELGLKESSTKLLPLNSVLIALAGQGKTRGTVAINKVELCTNQSLAALVANEAICPDYLYYNLDSRYDELRKESGGEGGRGGLNLEIIKNLSISFPVEPKEQEIIVKILSTWDEAIELLNCLIALKEKQKSQISLKILSGELRLTGFTKKWSIKKLKELGNCIRGLTYSPDNVTDSGILVLRSSNVQDGRIFLEDNVYVNLNIQTQYLTLPGDILICVRNGSRNLIGKTALIPNGLPKATHGAFMSVFRSSYSSYIFQLFQTQMYYEQVAKNLGATINSINNSDLLEFSFPFPDDVSELNEILTKLETFDSEILFLKKINSSYQKQKQGLMQQLLTGKKRVKV